MANVLIVDDSKWITKALAQFMESNGHTVVGIGHDGFEGEDLYKQLKPDLVLLDITMPNKDGRDCLDDILKFDPEAKVMILSAVGNPEIIQQCRRLGAKAYVQKPFKFKDEAYCNDFLNKVENILSGML